jgi:hypothetical protein
MAKLPPGSHRSLEDPYEDKEAARQRRRIVVFLVLVVLAAAAIWIRWDATKHRSAGGEARYFWQERAKPVAATPAPAAAPADAKK